MMEQNIVTHTRHKTATRLHSACISDRDIVTHDEIKVIKMIIWAQKMTLWHWGWPLWRRSGLIISKSEVLPKKQRSVLTVSQMAAAAQFWCSNVCFIMSAFACSCCSDGAEQEESASICEYVLRLAVNVFWGQLLPLISRVSYPPGKSLQIGFGMQWENSSLIYKEKKKKFFCAHDQTIMFNGNALNDISEKVQLFLLVHVVFCFFQIWQWGQWGHCNDDRLMFMTSIKNRPHWSLNETLPGFDVILFEHWIIVSVEENYPIHQHSSDKSSLSLVYINSKSVTPRFIYS